MPTTALPSAAELAALHEHPAGVAERGDPALRPATLGDRLQDVDRPGHRAQFAVKPGDVERVLPAPVGRMDHEAASGLDRAAVMDRAVRRFAGFDIELAQEARLVDAGGMRSDILLVPLRKAADMGRMPMPRRASIT